jgi:hypothetical protein
MFLHNLLNVLVQIASKTRLQKNSINAESKNCGTTETVILGNGRITCNDGINLNYWVMHPVARVSINIYI